MVLEVATYGLLFISLFFEVFLLVSFLERSRNRTSIATSMPENALPTAAIIVPCYNEATKIRATLQSLLALAYPKEKLEIIVVDDGSTDDTLAIAKEFETESASLPCLRVFHKENGGKHSALNFALARTQAELIGCLDADSTVAPEALAYVAPIFTDQRIAAVTPGIHAREQTNMLQRMQFVEYRLSVFIRFIFAALGSAYITPGPFSIFRASVVRELGGWRYAYSTEDLEMALRIQEKGLLICNAPKAIVYTATPPTFRGLFRQRVRWSYGFLRNSVDYRHMYGNVNFGNLGLIILPTALISIGAGIYFFARLLWNASQFMVHEIIRVEAGAAVPHATSFDAFYLPTSALWFLVCISVCLIILLISAGSQVGTDKRLPPRFTPLFVLFYAFLAPLWLMAAVVRATFKTGVRWK